MKTSTVILTATALAALPPVCAQFVNGSFETPAFISGNANVVDLPGWSRVSSGDAGVWVLPASGFFPSNAPDGRQIFYSNGPSIAQRTSNPIVVGTQTVTVQAARRNDAFAGSFRMTVFAGGTAANGAITGGTVLGSVDFDHTQVAANSFTPLVFTYTADAGDSLVGQLLGVQFVRLSGQMNFDQVVLSGDIVPEPSAAALGAALLALAWVVRRRRC